MKRAVVTIVCGEFHRRLAQITQPTIQAYAQKLGADWIAWDDYQGHTIPHYKKLDLGSLLDAYDRILYVDNDILIRDDAPDIFALVPQDKLGVLDESPFVDRSAQVIPFMEYVKYDPAQWDRRYYNTGVMVLSKQHKNLFAPPPVELDNGKEQTHLNVMISKTRTETFPLPFRFNRMLAMDSSLGEDRFDCFFLHYAGAYQAYSEEEQLELVADDLAVWQRRKPDYSVKAP